jgi:hypothetical protein
MRRGTVTGWKYSGTHPLLCPLKSSRVITDGFWQSFEKLISICSRNWSDLPFHTADCENGTEMETTWWHLLSISYVYEDVSKDLSTGCKTGGLPSTSWWALKSPFLRLRWIQRQALVRKRFWEPEYQVDKACYSGVTLSTQLTWLAHISQASQREHVDSLLSRQCSFVPSAMNHAWKSAAHIHIWKFSCIHHIHFLHCVLVYIDEVCSRIPQSTSTLLPDCKVSHHILGLLFLLKFCITKTHKKWSITRKITEQNWLDINVLNTVGWQRWANTVSCGEPWFYICGFLY